MTQMSYPTLEAFYADRPLEDRRLSREFDYGVHWTAGGRERVIYPRPFRGWPSWRVSYVVTTGEVIAVGGDRHHDDMVLVLGRVPAGSEDSHWDLDGLLAGWSDLDHEHRNLDWVRRMIGALPLGRDTFGHTCWRIPFRPGCHLAWGGPGDRVHLATGGRFDRAGDTLGTFDENGADHVDWRQCQTQEEAAEVAAGWLALEAQPKGSM